MPLFLSDGDLEALRHDGFAVAAKADSYIRDLYAQFETVKAQADAASITAEQTCSQLEHNYLSLSSDYSNLESRFSELESKLQATLSELAQVQAEKHQLHIKAIEKDGEIERMSTEVSELHKSKRQLMAMLEQKDAEISEKNSTIKSYLDKIVTMTENVAEREARLSDAEAELVRSRASCERLLLEKELIERPNAWLNEELTAKSNNLMELHRKYAEHDAEFSAKLRDVEKQYDESSKSIKWYKERVSELEMKLTSLQEDLCSTKDSAASNEERYVAEIATVSKLVELYKESSEEWSKKAGELEGVIKAMEMHLSQLQNEHKENVEKEMALRKEAEKKISSKDSPKTSLNSLNKFKSQIKKPSHRNGSPLNWIPRQKGDTYLKRKIQQLQEASGMNSTLDETLGTANPHYCRVLREKIASRQAAFKAMEARKAAMVEASWCRILKAARIQSKEAETLLLKAEKNTAEALDAATAKGVMMYDTIDCPQKPYVIETSSTKGKPFAQSLKAPLETAFEVDRQVASAVKTAFIRLAANCHSSLNKDEYSGLLMKISENPEADETSQDLSDIITSECESDAGLKFELGSEDSSLSVNQMDEEIMFGMFGRRQSPQNCNKESLDDIMLGRLKCLKEEELASLATIVATCGLNAALAEMENQHQDRNSYATYNSRRISTYGSRRLKNSSMDCLTNGLSEKQQSDVELPSLDKCLIKHMTKLEREVQDARNARKNDSVGGQENPVKSNSNKSNVNDVASSEAKHEPGLESILVKHSSKLEKEKAELKRKIGQIWELDQKEQPGEEGQIQKGGHGQVKQKVDEVPSLDKFLVKHVSRLEREVQEAKSRRNDESAPGSLANVLKKRHTAYQLEENRSSSCTEKENIDLNSNDAVHTEKDRLVKKVAGIAQPEFGKEEGGLDSILVKHKSKLEVEKMAAVQPDHDKPKHSLTRQKAREKEMQDAWGGMSLGNCVRPHLSRLEREKAAWIKAEEEKKAAICADRALP